MKKREELTRFFIGPYVHSDDFNTNTDENTSHSEPPNVNVCRCSRAPLPVAYKGAKRQLRATPRPAMASPALLLLVVCAFAAPLYAATIPDSADLQKIPTTLTDDIKDPLPANHEIIAPEPAKEVENEFRAKPEHIPVEVVVDDVETSVKINEVEDEETKRPAVDLRNPGPPQRQEHETQNPERHPDEILKVSIIKENIEKAQNLLRQSFQDVSDTIQNSLFKTDDRININKNIQNLRETFTSQVQKLNDTIQALVEPAASELVEEQREESQSNYKKIQSRLKVLANNFNGAVDMFFVGVDLVGNLRSSSDEGDAVKEEAPSQSGTAPATVTPSNPLSLVIGALNNIRDQVTSGFNNIQNLLTPGGATPPDAVQADTPDQTTSAPGLFGLQQLFTNSFAQFQSQLSNINLFGIRPSATVKPVQIASSSASDKPSKPEPEAAADNKPADEQPVDNKPADAADKPADAPAPAPAAQPAAATPAQPDAGGPIRQFLSSIPVVQRIQNSLTNRDTPREPIQKNDGQSKGGWYGPPGKPVGSGKLQFDSFTFITDR